MNPPMPIVNANPGEGSMKKNRTLVLATLAVTIAFLAQKDASAKGDEPGVFDYYALSLSWAPNYCASHQDDPSECGIGKRFGFVLHGLWPQFWKKWPQDCSTQKLTPEEEKKGASIYPSEKLMEHEWSKHGTCSGLGPIAYFDLSDGLRKSVKVPEAYQQPEKTFKTTSAELSKAFLDANPTLKAGSVLAVCSANKRFLSEIHVCFDKKGEKAIACSASETSAAKKSCNDSFLVQNVK
jgi:ribonuclease T2